MRRRCRLALLRAFLPFVVVILLIEVSANQDLGKKVRVNPDFAPIQNRMKALISKNVSPGVSMLVGRHGHVICREAFGTLTVDSAVPIASMTKSAIASAVMILVDQHKLSLNDPISKYLTEFRGTPTEKVTVRQLLCHTSGVIGVSNPLLGQDYLRPATHVELARYVAINGQIIDSGEFHYADTNYDLMCAIVERLGLNVEAFIRDTLFTPLGMASSFDHPEGMCIFCGGGMKASLHDIYALYQMHLNGGTYQGRRILSTSSVDEMRRKQASGQLADKAFVEYGLGFFRERVTADGSARTIYHSGFWGTLAWADIDTELVGVLFFDNEWQRVKSAALELQSAIRAIISSDR